MDLINVNLLKNPYNWVIVISILAIGTAGFWVVAKELGLSQ